MYVRYDEVQYLCAFVQFTVRGCVTWRACACHCEVEVMREWVCVLQCVIWSLHVFIRIACVCIILCV